MIDFEQLERLVDLARTWLDTDAGHATIVGACGALTTVLASRLIWPLIKRMGRQALGVSESILRWLRPTQDPLVQAVAGALADNWAQLEQDRNLDGLLHAGGLEFALRVDDLGHVFSVSSIRAGDRDIWPDLTETEQRKILVLCRATVLRVRDRERKLSRASSLTYVRTKQA